MFRAAVATPLSGDRRLRWTKATQRVILVTVIGLAFALAGSAWWLGAKATTVKEELEQAIGLVPQLQSEILDGRSDAAATTAKRLGLHTAAARNATEDPIWTLASAVPLLGDNLSAVAEVARSADDVSVLAVTPLVRVSDSLSWDTLLLGGSRADLNSLREASPSVMSAAHAVRVSAQRLNGIDASLLLPQVSEPLVIAREQLMSVTGALDASAAASQLAPGMLGGEGSRNYLLIIQNNAESRASGGIPGALAVLTFDKGKLALGSQSSAADVGIMSPIVTLDLEQQQIYSGRMGKFMQDVNLTPDFPTAASTAQAMWERKTGQRVDGVISIDPVAMGYILDATGPVEITDSELVALASVGLPTELTGKNVVQTLLSDVYAKINQPALQDVYFAGVAQEIFAALSDSKGNAKGLIHGLTRGTSEGRVLIWSGLPAEQTVLAKYAVSGSVSGPSVAPAQFGVYFNDGTGAKMDYYVKRTVQLIKECAREGYQQTTVRVTSTNVAPADAATSLPAYVTGGGVFGVPAGSVQTNIVAYGPVQANMETAKLDGQRTDFAAHRHANRPVGVLAVKLAPGESKTVEFTFGKIVQHTEPNLVVTPTVQAVKDVILPTQTLACG
ncbi:hypothetical protein DAD99_04775 [Pseudarthrobacter sp. AB1]|nr:hypothetical protein [Pseudarthrobacter sp. AB1]